MVPAAVVELTKDLVFVHSACRVKMDARFDKLRQESGNSDFVLLFHSLPPISMIPLATMVKRRLTAIVMIPASLTMNDPFFALGNMATIRRNNPNPAIPKTVKYSRIALAR